MVRRRPSSPCSPPSLPLTPGPPPFLLSMSAMVIPLASLLTSVLSRYYPWPARSSLAWFSLPGSLALALALASAVLAMTCLERLQPSVTFTAGARWLWLGLSRSILAVDVVGRCTFKSITRPLPRYPLSLSSPFLRVPPCRPYRYCSCTVYVVYDVPVDSR